MASYVKDDTIGLVHVMSPVGDGEFTFCGRATDGDYDCEGFLHAPSRGPADCHECKKAVDELRAAMSGARWRLSN